VVCCYALFALWVVSPHTYRVIHQHRTFFLEPASSQSSWCLFFCWGGRFVFLFDNYCYYFYTLLHIPSPFVNNHYVALPSSSTKEYCRIFVAPDYFFFLPRWWWWCKDSLMLCHETNRTIILQHTLCDIAKYHPDGNLLQFPFC
jgi:hypothetical protein